MGCLDAFLSDVQDSDLRSALLLEQAAHCFIHMRIPMVRKFAFHMILAGHRYSKAGQVSLSLTAHMSLMAQPGVHVLTLVLPMFPEEARTTLLLSSHAGVQRAGLVFGRGPHQLHHRAPVFHPGPTGERSTSLPTDSDQWKQTDGHAAGGFSQRVSLCFQGDYTKGKRVILVRRQRISTFVFPGRLDKKRSPPNKNGGAQPEDLLS